MGTVSGFNRKENCPFTGEGVNGRAEGLPGGVERAFSVLNYSNSLASMDRVERSPFCRVIWEYRCCPRIFSIR